MGKPKAGESAAVFIGYFMQGIGVHHSGFNGFCQGAFVNLLESFFGNIRCQKAIGPGDDELCPVSRTRSDLQYVESVKLLGNILFQKP